MKYTNFKSGMRLISPQTYTYAASTCMEQDTLCLGPCPCQHPPSPQVCYFDTYHYQFFPACSSIPCKWPCWTNSLLALLFLHHIYKSMQSGNVASLPVPPVGLHVSSQVFMPSVRVLTFGLPSGMGTLTLRLSLSLPLLF